MFVALGTSGQNNKPYGWARSLCSIGFFVIGCFSFSRLHKLVGGARLRRTLIISFSLQTLCVITAAALIQVSTGTEGTAQGSRQGENWSARPSLHAEQLSSNRLRFFLC